MVKTLNITASYKDDTQIFICQQKEFLGKVAERFKIDAKNIVLYAVNKTERYKIKPSEILDLMKIEIVDRKAAVTNGTGRNLRSFFTVEPKSLQNFEHDVIEKLSKNTPLTGTERKQLIEWLESNPPSILGKRKRNESNAENETVHKEIAHKRIQVDVFSSHSKDSFTQTDAVNISELNDVQSQERQAEYISQKIKRLAYNGSADKEEIEKLMNDSFDDRRLFILTKIPPVAAVRDKYPLLFSFEEVKNELGRIFYPGINQKFLNNMVKYSKHILDSCDPNDDIYLRTYKSIDRAHTEKQKIYARVVGSVFALSKVLDEDFRFIHLNDNPHSSSDIYPHIDAACYSLKEVFFDNIVYNIIVEEKKLCEAPNLLDAVLCLMAAFFIFNIDYPESCRRTLIVFEKIFLQANDSTDIDEMAAQMIKMLELRAKS